MPPHLVKRKGRQSTYYVVDGRYRKSTNTANKGIAEYELRQYILGKHGLSRLPTVKEYYEKWIETKKEPLVRKSLIRSYRQHFDCYILSALGTMQLCTMNIQALSIFRSNMLTQGLSLKTTRNIIDSSLRAMWRDASQEYELKNPFQNLTWPRVQRQRPDPFSIEERDYVLSYFRSDEPFYYPWVLTMFSTGMRPSEAIALIWEDVNLEDGTISITKSRHLKATAATKTEHSSRIIAVARPVLEALEKLRTLPVGHAHIFSNKFGMPLDANQWARDYFGRILRALGIRYRKFYATRHTFITEAVKAGQNLKAIADYCGTSVAMIEKDYCGKVELNLGSSKQGHPLGIAEDVGVAGKSNPQVSSNLPQATEKPLQNIASPTGFESVGVSTLKSVQVLSMREYELSRSRRRA